MKNFSFINFLPPWVETNIQPAFYDKESGSVLQQTARMYAKVNQLVRHFNCLSKETKETVDEYIAKFVELKDFVDTYFENLDVQEEINNKLDAMVEDGTLQTLLANYLVICGGNAKELGCAGDGITDDTTAINTAITNLKTTGIYKLVFPEGEYAISGEIIVPSNFTIECMDGAVLKYVGEGKTGNIFKAIGTSNLVPVENITLKNINIDGSAQGYKGGASDATPLVTSTAPKYKGLVAMYFKWAKNVKIVGCNLNDIYGDGIKFSHCCNVKIVDNYLKDCSGGNIRSGGDSGYDNFGDGIVAFSCWDTLIDGNTIINTRVYQASATASDIGKQCGRSGVEFEYGLHQDGYDAPDTDLFQSSDGIGLLATNNFIYGYTKGGHFETNVKFRFDNNTVINCHIGAMMSIDGNSSASNNYFNDNGVGVAPQSGYDTYYCGIALSNYGSLINGKFVISGNVFDCTTSSGIGVAKDNVEIVDNQFYNGGIVTVANPANNTTVANNNFYEAHIFIYTTKGWQIIGNNFKCKTSNAIQIEGGENITISNNNINNSINIPSNSKDIYILGNHFESESDYTPINGNAFVNLYQGSNIVFKDNIVNLKKNNTTKLFATPSNINCIKFLDNSIKVDTTRSNSVVTFGATIKYLDIEGNKLYGFNDYVAFIDHSYTITTSSIKENVTDNSTAYIYKQTTGGQWGRHCIEQNIGIVKFNGIPNDSTSKFVNTYMNLGERIYKFGTNTGWYVSRSGYYTTTNYANGTVTVGTYVISNTDYVYKCITGGTASVAPTGTTEGSTETGADGVKWLCCGKVATLTSL